MRKTDKFLIMIQEWYRVEYYSGREAFADSPILDKVWGGFECPSWPEIGSGSESSLVYDEVAAAGGSSSKYGSMGESGKLRVVCNMLRIRCCS